MTSAASSLFEGADKGSLPEPQIALYTKNLQVALSPPAPTYKKESLFHTRGEERISLSLFHLFFPCISFLLSSEFLALQSSLLAKEEERRKKSLRERTSRRSFLLSKTSSSPRRPPAVSCPVLHGERKTRRFFPDVSRCVLLHLLSSVRKEESEERRPLC